ncbi:MAG TPA: TIGR01620 family protein [Devosia sp.]|nr:TIGR01620 family protein [Devosia sp.]
MKKPAAFRIDDAPHAGESPRGPRAFDPAAVTGLPAAIDTLSDTPPEPEIPLTRMSWLGRILWTSAGLLVSLAIGLWADALIRDLFAAYPALGWAGVALAALFVLALIALIVRETSSLWRLRALDHLKSRALATLAADNLRDARSITAELATLYAPRADMARPLTDLNSGMSQLFDGAEIIRYAERTLMTSLDARARALTAASARRVALVTAVSPRALVDIAFVTWESIRLGGAIARLYGARPGVWSSFRLIGAILGHLAVTGGLVLTDGVIEQLVGQGLAARLSQRLGEGVVNGLMTVRVGIAAMRVVRPLPFAVEPQPMVKDFLPELANVLKQQS